MRFSKTGVIFISVDLSFCLEWFHYISVYINTMLIHWTSALRFYV